MKVLMITLGSAGDVHPFLAVGKALKERGHQVTLATSEFFQELAMKQGLEFIPLGKKEDYEEILKNPDFWNPKKGIGLLVKTVIIPAVSEIYRLIEAFDRRDTVVAASTLVYGARVAQEKLGVPLVTIHLQPYSFLSFVDPPVSPIANTPSWFPRWLNRPAWNFFDFIADRTMGSGVNRFRQELGLERVSHVMTRWIHSTERVVGLFPEWYAPPAGDWPEQSVLTGFVRFDGSVTGALAPEVEEFLEAGDPPVAFTPGTAMAYGEEFFHIAVSACRRIGKRAALITRFSDCLPSPLPEGTAHLGYVPFSDLFPRCAALVHHGGIGTTAQALAAGIPQVVMPMSFDQPDNAARIEKLGVGRSLPPNSFTPSRLGELLEELLDSREVRSQCRALAGKVDFHTSLEKACAAIETLRPEID